MKNRNSIFIIVNAVLIFSINAVFISCKNKIEEVNKLTVSNNRPSFSVEGLETYFSDSGIIKVKIFAPELERYEQLKLKYDEYPQGINVEFYDYNMKITGTLKCQYARYLIVEEVWEAKSNVEVNNTEKNEKINTELLYWDIKNERIYSDKFVRITTAEEILFGEGFESNQDFSKWKIINPTGTINIKDE